MMRNHKWSNIVLSLAAAGGMTAFATVAQAQNYSSSTVRKAQQQLKADGFYSGSVDGVYGPRTKTAIRNFQQQNNLNVTGTLDDQTKDMLASSKAERSAQRQSEASRSATPPETAGVTTPSSATVSAAQRRLEQQGFYKGNIDGAMGPRTRAAVREYQKSSNLNVTGKLDQATLSKLGVSK